MEGVMRKKLAALVAFCPWLLFGCGLETSGSGPGDDDYGPSDVPAEEAGPDISGDEVPDTAEDHFELVEEDASPETADEAGPDETEETADEAADSAEAEDAGPDESGEEDGETEDGGTADPCAPPDIPTTGLWLWYCIPGTTTLIDMTVEREVNRLSEPDILWGLEPACSRHSTRILLCSMTDYGAASIYVFNITTPGFDPGWSCGPGLEVTHGVPRIWYYGWELEVGVVANHDGGCNHTFEIAPL